MNTTSFICTLDGDIQKLIYMELIKLKETYNELDIHEIMSGRLCDLEGLIDINKYI